MLCVCVYVYIMVLLLYVFEIVLFINFLIKILGGMFYVLRNMLVGNF